MPSPTASTALSLALTCLTLGLGACQPSDGRPSAAPGAATSDLASQGVTRLRGRALGHDGRALPLGHLSHRSGPGQQAVAVALDADGSFELELDGTGFTDLSFTGVSHARYRVRVPLDGGEHTLELRLGTHDREPAVTTRERLGAVVEFRGAPAPADADPGAPRPGQRVEVELTRQADGSFAALVEPSEADRHATELAYQLVGLTRPGHTVNGTQAARFEYDGGGDYLSVLTIEGPGEGPVELRLDPAALPPAGVEPQFTASTPGDPSSPFATIIALSQAADELVRTTRDAGEARAKARPAEAEAERDAARLELIEGLAARARAETGPARAAALVLWVEAVRGDLPYDEALLDELLATLGPADPMWSLRAWSMPQALKLRPEPEYRDQALRQHPDDELVAGLLYNQLEAALREPGPAALAQIRAAYEALQDERFAGTVGQFIARQHDPDRSTAPGQPLPAFSFPRLRGGDPITPESLRGRAYVLDFWSTACKPCIAEMPRLHRAYAALNGVALPPERAKQPASYRDLALDTPRVEFVSIALDDEPDEVRRLQAEGWPMPWPNTVPADDDANADLWQRFNLVGVPTMIVVDAEGTILASGTHVRADDLAALLPPSP